MAIELISGTVLRAQPDETLCTLAAQGSEAAFEAIVQRYRRPLQRYCRRLLLSDSRGEDAVQQAFLNAWEALRRGAKVRSLRPWLYRITHNQAVAQLRETDLELTELSGLIAAGPGVEVDVERRLAVREALAAVAGLPDRQREAILRTAVEGRSYEEVAAALGVSDNVVRGLVNRARTALRAGLAAVAPTPLVGWAAARARQGMGFPQGLGELIASGGPGGGATVALKGATVVATSAMVVGGAVGGTLNRTLQSIRPAPPRAPRALLHRAPPPRRPTRAVAATSNAGVPSPPPQPAARQPALTRLILRRAPDEPAGSRLLARVRRPPVSRPGPAPPSRAAGNRAERVEWKRQPSPRLVRRGSRTGALLIPRPRGAGLPWRK